MMTYIVLGITVGCILFGFLLGLVRGFNRSLLRMIIVLACVAGAWLLKDVFVNLLLKIEIGGEPLEETISSLFVSEGSDLPESLVTFIFLLIQILLGVALFLILFILLKFISWTIIFPICKLFVKKGKSKKALLGGVIGLVQGALVAFVLCFPFTGLMVQVNGLTTSLTEIEMDGQPLMEAEVKEKFDSFGIAEYEESALGKFYVNVGGGLYNKLATAKDENGNKMSLDSAVNAMTSAVKIAGKLSDLTTVDFSEGITGENVKKVSDALRDIGEIVNGDMTEESREIVNNLINDVVKSMGGEDSEISLPEDFDISSIGFEEAADAVDVIGKITDKENEGEEYTLTDEDAEKIVNGIAANESLISAMAGDDANLVGGTLEGEEKTKVENAINKADVDEATKERLKKMLGVSASSTTVPSLPESGTSGGSTGSESGTSGGSTGSESGTTEGSVITPTTPESGTSEGSTSSESSSSEGEGEGSLGEE